MKKRNLTTILLCTAFLFFSFCAVNAQNESDENNPPPENEPFVRRNLLRDLGLTKEQFQQIRKLNSQRKPIVQEAQQKLREANRNLDQAIYADSIDESAIQMRLKEVQISQAEVSKIRAFNELEVRKILTPEQLVKFRELREKFMNRVKINQQNRQERQRDQINSNLNNGDSTPKIRRKNNRQRP